jgi:DNA polymerase III epsilon subunit
MKLLLLILAACIAIAIYIKSKKSTQTKLASKLPISMPKQLIVFDLETTGLDPYKDEIIEIAAIKINTESTHHEAYQTLVKPSKKIPKRATEINGITNEMVEQEGKSQEIAIKEFIDFIGDLRLVAYNADFDISFIKSALEKHNLTIKNEHSCALKMARRAWKGLDSYKLENLCNRAGISTKGNHRALKDCELAGKVYFAAASKLQSIK